MKTVIIHELYVRLLKSDQTIKRITCGLISTSTICRLWKISDSMQKEFIDEIKRYENI